MTAKRYVISTAIFNDLVYQNVIPTDLKARRADILVKTKRKGN